LKELSIIIPAYNEENNIKKCIQEVERTFHNPGLNYEVIVVDNNSTDNTYRIAKKAANNKVKVIECLNRGKGAAIKAGFNKSKGKFVTFVDADLELHPKQIPLFMDYMKRYDADIVVGSKRHPLSKIYRPMYRKILSFGYYILIKLLFGLPVKDTQAGLKLYKREVLNEIFPRILCKRYAFDLEILVNAHHRGFKLVEAPIEYRSKRLNNRIKLKDIFYIALDTAAIFYRLRIMKYYNGVAK